MTANKIYGIVRDLEDHVLLKLWNDVATATERIDYIFSMNKFDEIMRHRSPYEIAKLICESPNFNVNDSVFIIDECCVQSSNNGMDFVDVDYLVDALMEEQDSVYGYDLEWFFKDFFTEVEDERRKKEQTLMNSRRAG